MQQYSNITVPPLNQTDININQIQYRCATGFTLKRVFLSVSAFTYRVTQYYININMISKYSSKRFFYGILRFIMRSNKNNSIESQNNIYLYHHLTWLHIALATLSCLMKLTHAEYMQACKNIFTFICKLGLLQLTFLLHFTAEVKYFLLLKRLTGVTISLYKGIHKKLLR